MQQKVQFIVATLHDPDLLILDEPFAGLDPVNLELLMETVRELKDAGKTIILSTHLMEQAESLCDDICLLNRSRKVLDGSLREVKRGFARNMVALRVEGGDGVLDDRGLVAGIETHGDGVKALLAEGASAHDLLRRLLAAGALVSKFEIVEPSLHDIFIAQVSQRDV
jgi:ABC-2 type transport system ATP-binding protein